MHTTLFEKNADEFERTLAFNIKNAHDYIKDDNNVEWTKAAEKILWETVKVVTHNCKVAANKNYLNTSDYKQWLYDFMSYITEDDGCLSEVILIAEIEWKKYGGNVNYYNDVRYEFEKLMLGRARYRLMLFEGDNLQEIESIIEGLKSDISNFKQSKHIDRYLFAAKVINTNNFYFDSHIHCNPE